MKTEKQKEIEKHIYKIRKTFCLSLNHHTATLLENDMKKNGWTNAAAYIKFKLFGYNPEEDYKRKARGQNIDFSSIAIRNLLDELVRQLDFLNKKYSKELEEFKILQKDVPDLRKSAKWVSLLTGYQKEIKKKTDLIIEDCIFLLETLSIEPSNDVIRAIESTKLNWNDTTSDQAIQEAQKLIKEIRSRQ